MTEIYDWKIGWLEDGEFTEDEHRENGQVYGNAMQLQSTCDNCGSEMKFTTNYDPVPMHYESLIACYKLQLKCKCGAVYALGDGEIEYRIDRIETPDNKNQLQIF